MSGYTHMLTDAAHQAYRDGRHEEAEALVRLAIGRDERSAYWTYFLGHRCYLRGRLDDALGYLSTAVELDPHNGHARNDLGETLRALGRNEEALPQLEQAVALSPRLAHAYGNLAATLMALNRPEEALRWAQESLWRADDKAVAHCDLGSIFGRLGRAREAIRQYDLALGARPGDPRARYFQSLMRLSLGEMPAGWEAHEDRLRLPNGIAGHRQYPHPSWHGEDGIQGMTMLLHAEQGLGDTIQFARYAPLAAKRGATILLEVQAPLKSLFAGLEGVSAVYAHDEPLPPVQVQCPLMSLPFAFATSLDTIPSATPYITARPDRIAAWAETLGPW